MISSLVNRAESIFLVSMMRSGHHAVLNWFARNQLRPILHLNDCRIEGGALRPDPPNLLMYYNGHIGRYLLDESPGDLECLSEDCSTIICSFEERSSQYVRAAAEIVRPSKIIVVVRDALNFVASCMKHAEKYPQVRSKIIDTMHQRLEIWCDQARELQRGSSGSICGINYNLWFSSKSYRDAVAADHGFMNQDIGIDEVLLFGQGSSFDDLAYDNSASQMAVLSRWHEYRRDPCFRSYMSEEAIELSARLFGVHYRDTED
jgi:hypothetical protein